HPPAAFAGPPRAACLAAARRAEAVHGLPEGLMVAVALSESGLHAHALNIRGRAHFPDSLATARALLARAGGRAMAGCVQVNAGVHARGSDWPLDAERAADWAGGLIARGYQETGSWNGALARFHGGSPAGTRRVICRVRAKLAVAAPGSPLLRELGCGGAMDARVLRSGAALLEIAEAR
ncbi:MAG: transglycosylase, partial [Acetobacteraceae bacterium]|nr:transglycosylase [Acetobacteraceae bacterium]